MTESSKNLLPLELTNDVTLRNVQDIADVIIAEVNAKWRRKFFLMNRRLKTFEFHATL